VTWAWIRIYLKNLLKLLRSVVQKYAGQSLKGDMISVAHPFEMLAHYYHDLGALKNGTLDILAKSSHEESSNAEQPALSNQANLLDQATVYDLNVLLSTFKLHYIKHFAPEEARHNVGFTSFGLIWFLFKPGVDVYARIGGKLAAFAFKRRGERERDPRLRPEGYGMVEIDRKNNSIVAHCWSLTYNS
jgi:hypothetical protein